MVAVDQRPYSYPRTLPTPWARTVGVLLAGIVAVVSFAWLPWYPVWGVLLITLSVIVIWALTAHGRDITRKGEDHIPREG